MTTSYDSCDNDGYYPYIIKCYGITQDPFTQDFVAITKYSQDSIYRCFRFGQKVSVYRNIDTYILLIDYNAGQILILTYTMANSRRPS